MKFLALPRREQMAYMRHLWELTKKEAHHYWVRAGSYWRRHILLIDLRVLCQAYTLKFPHVIPALLSLACYLHSGLERLIPAEARGLAYDF
jgi:hypothetical protein